MFHMWSSVDLSMPRLLP